MNLAEYIENKFTSTVHLDIRRTRLETDSTCHQGFADPVRNEFNCFEMFLDPEEIARRLEFASQEEIDEYIQWLIIHVSMYILVDHLDPLIREDTVVEMQNILSDKAEP